MTRVRIVCTEESHARKVAVITEFIRLGKVWSESPSAGRPGPLRPRQLTGRVLVADEPVSTFDEMLDGHPHTRTGHTLRCPLCGLDVNLRQETLSETLDKLAAAGVSDFPLRLLAARFAG